MANQNAPFGFRLDRVLEGLSPNYGFYTGLIASNNANAIYTGDTLKPISAGYFDVMTTTAAACGGVAAGFNWVSKAAGGRVWRPYWPGTSADVLTDVSVKIEINPQSVFLVQASSTAITQTQVGLNATFVSGSGNTYSGVSAFALDSTTISTLTTLPFTIYRVLTTPDSDPTSAYNTVEVIFNRLTPT